MIEMCDAVMHVQQIADKSVLPYNWHPQFLFESWWLPVMNVASVYVQYDIVAAGKHSGLNVC